MESEKKFIEYKQKLLELNKDNLLFEKLKKDGDLNRNYQFQIYLLSELDNNDEDLKTIIKELQSKNIMIHIFNEFLSKEQVCSLLESNHYKLNQDINKINPNFAIEELKQQLEQLKKIEEKENLTKKYIDCFEKSKSKKWFKLIRKKALNTAAFLALFTKKRDEKFKSLMHEAINNLNLEFDLKIDINNPDYEFVKVYYDYIINWSIKKSLIIVLISLSVIFVIVLTVILLLTQLPK